MGRDGHDRYYEGYSSAPKKRKEKKSDFGTSKKFEKGFEAYEKKYGDPSNADRERQDNQEYERRKKQYEADRAASSDYAQKFIEQPSQGLSPEQRRAMQYEGERQITRARQADERKLLGEQSQRGIVGRGGVGFAQRADLRQRANEQRGGVTRDLNKLNADLALKNKAAQFSVLQGETAARQLQRQEAADKLEYDREQRRLRRNEYGQNRNFGKI